jgi:uncharacterized oxidoreductase
MKTSGNTILITGGASGIGLAMAEVFLASGNKVVICDIRKLNLIHAQRKLKNIQIEVCDVTNEEAVAKLAKKMEDQGGINILINNAGIGRHHDFQHQNFSTQDTFDEMNVNFFAPIRLTTYFLNQLKRSSHAAIINISSGLAYVPYYKAPIYSASKSALHAYTCALRYQLRNTNILVFEVFPPSVDTEMSKNQPNLMTTDELAKIILKGLSKNKLEIRAGGVRKTYLMNKFMPSITFKKVNRDMDIRISEK